MSEESNDGTMSGLVKTIIGTVGTIVTAGGAWLGSQMFGGGEQPAAPAAAPVINITQNQAQQQATGGNKTIIINKGGNGGDAKPAKAEPAKPKKDADEFKEKPAAW